jgi:citrate lyase subunit beta/citryl-CoA lyase
VTATTGPREALVGADDAAPGLPVCDHYCGTEPRMAKALALQAELGPLFDITLDCEDGAPVGAEAAHAALCSRIVLSEANRFGRIGVRVHPVDHPAFEAELQTLIGRAGGRLAYLMLPKPRDAADVRHAIGRVQAVAAAAGHGAALPVHVLVETHGALREVFAIAAEPRIESISFGLMDFVSAHRGAIPQSAMGMSPTGGQFDHPLVLRAKLEIAAACHAHGKTPSHCVVTEFKDSAALSAAAKQARTRLGYTRMWSIHPDQIRPIVAAFAPTAEELDQAIAILRAAQAANWAPIQHDHALHDRASYRYFWQVIARAQRMAAAGGPALPADVQSAWFG